MRPIGAITLIVLGSSFAITVCLAGVTVVVLLLGDEYPRRNHELTALLTSLLLFIVMTTVSASSFYAITKNHPFKYAAQLLMWLGLALTAWYYVP